MVGTILRVICSMFENDSDLFHINMLSHAPWTTQRIHQLVSLIISRWFQILFIFTPIWGRFPIWLIFFRWVETTNQLRVCLWKCIWPLRFECFVQLVQAHKMILTRSWGWGVQRSRPGPIVPGVWVYQWPLSPARLYAAVFLPSSRDVCRRNACEAKNLVNGGFSLQSHLVFLMTIHHHPPDLLPEGFWWAMRGKYHAYLEAWTCKWNNCTLQCMTCCQCPLIHVTSSYFLGPNACWIFSIQPCDSFLKELLRTSTRDGSEAKAGHQR